ncbi:MAG: zinc ribbon domain-containing protein [Acidimicrobiales bacterium]
MPLYEYRCRTCDEAFELRRPMSESSAPAECPQGHVDSVRLLSVFASVGGSSGSSPASAPAPKATGGVCGSSCGCHH